ncbi:MAG TPA: DUF5118 domain-containing protein, partial [Candidatus Polarisedimenticolia bacterium]|nr:DUF5118 domain-containing protein [Candidatus Polarisedimenticolia bacterium]
MRRSPMLVVLISLLTLAVSAPRALPAAEQTGQPAGVTAAKDSDGVELPAFGKKKDKEEPKPPAGPGPGKKDEPAFEEVVKDSEKIDGLFTVYKKDDRYLIEIKPDQMDKDFMISVTRETGIAQLFDGVQMLVDNPVRFHKVGKRVQLLLANNRFEAMGDPDVKRAVEKSFSPSLIGSSKIESEPHPDRKSVLIDLAPLLLTDVEGVGPFLAQAMQSPCGLDRENSDVTRVLGFPLNMEMEARLHFS